MTSLSEEQFDVASEQHVLVLEAGRAERHYWRDIWAYRELFAILAWRDVAVVCGFSGQEGAQRPPASPKKSAETPEP